MMTRGTCQGEGNEPLTDEELPRFEGYAATIFARMGMDLNTPGARETPQIRDMELLITDPSTRTSLGVHFTDIHISGRQQASVRFTFFRPDT
jgi:hypothetical protein